MLYGNKRIYFGFIKITSKLDYFVKNLFIPFLSYTLTFYNEILDTARPVHVELAFFLSVTNWASSSYSIDVGVRLWLN